MRGRTDIAIISLAFTAGVALAQVTGWRWLPVPAAGIAVLSFIIQKRKSAAFAVLFFSTGAFIASVRYGMDLDILSAPRLYAVSKAQRLRAFIAAIPWPHEGTGPLLTALLTGDRKGLAPQTVQAFRDSGAAHILALSGLHLGVIYGIIRSLMAPLGKAPAIKKARAATTIGLCAFYTLMAGAGPSLVRALLFIIIRELTLLDPERRSDIGRTLFVALMVQLAASPEVIRQVGFQLSYLAMAGIVIIHPRMEAWYPEGKGPVRKVWESLSLSISCQLTTAPLVWLRFRTFPQMFLLTNFLSLPLCGLLIPCGVLAITLSALCPSLSGPVVVAADALAGAMLWIMDTIADIRVL